MTRVPSRARESGYPVDLRVARVGRPIELIVSLPRPRRLCGEDDEIRPVFRPWRSRCHAVVLKLLGGMSREVTSRDLVPVPSRRWHSGMLQLHGSCSSASCLQYKLVPRNDCGEGTYLVVCVAAKVGLLVPASYDMSMSQTSQRFEVSCYA